MFSDHNVLVGDNNVGKSSVLEAIDLVLGPERLSKHGAIDEHDFYAGKYIDADGEAVSIKLEVIVIELNDEQKRYFKDHLEWWDTNAHVLLDGPPAEMTDAANVLPALRVGFTGSYDKEEDDFTTTTYFLSPVPETGEPVSFKTADKRLCGFLFLRTLCAAEAPSLEIQEVLLAGVAWALTLVNMRSPEVMEHVLDNYESYQCETPGFF